MSKEDSGVPWCGPLTKEQIAVGRILELEARFPAEAAVIRAAVAWTNTEPGSDAEYGAGNELHAAAHVLLAAQPEWRK